MEKKDIVFTEGMFVKKPHPNAPEYVRARISFKANEFIAFLNKHKGADGWVNADVLESKDKTKLYGKLDTWKPEGAPKQEQQLEF